MARRLGVSRDDVVDAAVRLSDTSGLHALTVAAVADAVGCRPPSVYHHVDGLAGLSRAVALRATRDLNAVLEEALQGRTGIDACRAVAEATRGWAAAHPHRFEAVRYHDDEDDAELAGERARTAVLFNEAVAGLGVDDAERPPLVALLRAALRGGIDGPHDEAIHGGGELATTRAAGNDLLIDLTLDHLATVARPTATA